MKASNSTGSSSSYTKFVFSQTFIIIITRMVLIVELLGLVMADFLRVRELKSRQQRDSLRHIH